jgi:hypothetical protein
VQLLAQDWSAALNYPDRTRNRMYLASLRGERTLSEAARLQGVVFARHNRTLTANGDHTDWMQCSDPRRPGSCAASRAAPRGWSPTTAGNNVPFDAVHPYDASENATRTTQRTYGGAAQLAFEHPLGARENHFFVGASGDEGRARFSAQSAWRAPPRPRRAAHGHRRR